MTVSHGKVILYTLPPRTLIFECYNSDDSYVFLALS